MLPLSYGLEVIHFLEHHKTHGHHRHYSYHQHYHHHHHHKDHECIKLESSLGNLINLTHEPLQLVFKNVSISCGSQLILHKVFGKANPGEILAIMGPSGSGKTTLLKGLSGRISTSEGTITLNGEPLRKSHKHRLAVVEQQDAFKSKATLRQTLRLHAKLRLPSSLTNQQKLDYMNHFAKALNLSNLLDTTMGDVEKRGLSGGELKRANIACEMLSNPSLLFVDEPTSGLDSVHALSVINLLKSYAVEYNRTVVVTVHQPSSQMFTLFDKLLLLCEGKMAYFGDGRKAVERLGELQMYIKPHYNPADFIMDQLYIEANKKKLLNAVEYPRGFYDSDENENDESANKTLSQNNKSTNGNLNTAMEKGSGVQMLVTMDPESIPSKPSITLGNGDSGRSSMLSSTGHSSSASLENLSCCDKWPIGVGAQTRHLIRERYLIDSIKRHAKRLNWIHTSAFIIVIAVVSLGIKKEEKFVLDINGWMFFRLAICMLAATFNYINEFAAERHVINRERVSGMYCLCAYYIAKTVTSLPIMQLQFLLLYTITQLVFDLTNFTTLFLEMPILLLGVLFSQSVGVFVNAFCHDVHKATVISSVFAIPNLLLGGVFVNHLPWYVYWLKYLSSTHYALQAIKFIEFTYGDPIRCAAKNSIYAACNRNATFIPPSDLINDGTEVFSSLLPNILVLLTGSGVFLVLGYLALRFYKSPTNAI